MDLLNAIIIFCVFVGSIIYVIKPLFDQGLQPLKSVIDQNSLQIRKKTLYKEIKELEMDFEIGKIAEPDFNDVRAELKNEVAGIIAELNKQTKS
ncbi:hypothetical protein ACFL3L_02825 [Candidatus Neomarinimicrobiota bacterium]